MNPKVCAITATCGRHRCIERSIRFFLDQDYDNCVQLIYQNSWIAQELDFVNDGNIILVNNSIDYETKLPYTNLGAIYRDALTWVPSDTDIIIFWDDDDIFLPNHISEGVKGLLKSGKTAYKPAKSYYRHSGGIALLSNTLEPSIFVKASHIREHGFRPTTVDQHLHWVEALKDDIEVNEDGIPTLVYNWGDNFRTFKTSGDPNNDANFSNYRTNSLDHGDRIITPVSKEIAEAYYGEIPEFHEDN